jgi:hypothetical protein
MSCSIGCDCLDVFDNFFGKKREVLIDGTRRCYYCKVEVEPEDSTCSDCIRVVRTLGDWEQFHKGRFNQMVRKLSTLLKNQRTRAGRMLPLLAVPEPDVFVPKPSICDPATCSCWAKVRERYKNASVV